MTESEFIVTIDCDFPYDIESEWKQAIRLGFSISSNAAFMTLHEICRIPRSKTVSTESRRLMVDFFRQIVIHELLDDLVLVAEAMIEGLEISVTDSIRIMKIIALYPNQYNALALPYFACDDIDGSVDELYQKIVSAWQDA